MRTRTLTLSCLLFMKAVPTMFRRKGTAQLYKRLFERILRESGILYLAIDETKKSIYESKSLKNFDSIIS